MQNLIVTQLMKKFAFFYGTRSPVSMKITVLQNTCITRYSVADVCWRFWELCSISIQVRRVKREQYDKDIGWGRGGEGNGAMIEPIGLRRKVNAQDEVNMFLRKSVNVYQSMQRRIVDSNLQSLTWEPHISRPLTCSLGHFLSQMNPVHTLEFFKVKFNVILSFQFVFSDMFLPLEVSH